ncbi:hypothetical protein [Pedobacter mucosus]|uniref:hypothetical protein n=1 Tax=Pedobacter mucosus TaxID=2895286 RepID=UPI001EE488C4|nr:hypothetical protein [Pedobacter mucosus]UKT62732.1 hypothetical protein LOK61_13275 [Pedobacter mucosus]
MRLWLARIFIGLSFCLLLAHNLISHHHDEDISEIALHHHHDEDHDNEGPTVFDHISIDGSLAQKLNFQHHVIYIPVTLPVQVYNFEILPIEIKPQRFIIPRKHPPSWVELETSALRGPPTYC